MPITFKQALQVWWGYMWRSMVLFLPVMGGLPLVVFLFVGAKFFQEPTPPDPSRIFPMMGVFFVIWLAAMALMIGLQVAAMRWTLNSLGYFPTVLKTEQNLENPPTQ